jgi:hypothetical protein
MAASRAYQFAGQPLPGMAADGITFRVTTYTNRCTSSCKLARVRVAWHGTNRGVRVVDAGF